MGAYSGTMQVDRDRQLCTRPPVPHYRIISQKSFPGRQFISENPSHPAVARIFAGKLSDGADFSGGGQSYNRKTFCETGDILIKGRHINSVIISSRADFL